MIPMSAFGDSNYIKNDIAEYIQRFAEDNPDMETREIMKNIMEAVSYGIDQALYEIESKK